MSLCFQRVNFEFQLFSTGHQGIGQFQHFSDGCQRLFQTSASFSDEQLGLIETTSHPVFSVEKHSSYILPTLVQLLGHCLRLVCHQRNQKNLLLIFPIIHGPIYGLIYSETIPNLKKNGWLKCISPSEKVTRIAFILLFLF